MTQLAVDLEQRAKDAGISVGDLCQRAGIARSTFQRWKSGETMPQMRVYQRLEAVLLEAERRGE